MAQIFPRWTNDLPIIAPPVLTVAGVFAIFVIWYWFAPAHTDVGYAPQQPIPYSHKLHAGDLGMDCRYCHQNVEISPHAGVPPTETCLNCHNVVRKNSQHFARFRDSLLLDDQGLQKKDKFGRGMLKEDGASIPWLRIHKVPDYAYFDHSAHVTVGVGCVSCHGRVDQMVVVEQKEPLAMGWCLDCHRDVRHYKERGAEPADYIRPPNVPVTDMTWGAEHPAYAGWQAGAKKIADKMRPPTVECSGCHR